MARTPRMATTAKRCGGNRLTSGLAGRVGSGSVVSGPIKG
jgi:hypothetical protein